MVGLGIAELILLALLLLAVFLAFKGRASALSVLVAVVLVLVLSERLAPGTLATIGNTIHGIDRVDDSAPHLSIQPVIRFVQ